MPDDKRFSELESRLLNLEAFLQRVPFPVDPSPDDYGRWGRWSHWHWGGIGGHVPVGPHVDPVPIDISRLTKAQLEVSLESIKAQRIRLDAMENVIKEQLKQMR